MNKILANRVKLIRAMISAQSSISSYTARLAIRRIISLIREDKIGHFLSFEQTEPNRVTYAKQQQYKLIKNKRIVTSLQRFIRRQLSISVEDLQDVYLDKFCYVVFLSLDHSIDQKVKVISGQELVDFYRNNASKSCMTGSCQSHKIIFYGLNKDKVSMAIFNNEVRALLWKCDDGTIVLDRAYPAGHWGVEFLRTWAKRKGYVIRDVSDSVTTDCNNTLSDGKNHFIILKHYGSFPYLDTFKYGKINGNSIAVSNDPCFGDVILTSTDGGYVSRYKCSRCNSAIINDHTYRYDSSLEVYCRDCFYKDMFRCICCDGSYKSSEKHLNWNICEKCFVRMTAFITHNNCSCPNCVYNRQSYIGKISLQQDLDKSKIRTGDKQLSFNF